MALGGALSALARLFAPLSLLSFGGVSTVIPEIHRQTVELQHWITDRQFADFYAIAQAAPGPNFLLTTLIGFHVAGLAGALVATGAMCGPPSALVYLVARVWGRFRFSPWRAAVQAGLAPVTVGLAAASALVVIRAADHGVAALAVTAVTAVVAYATGLSPLWVFAAAAALGLTGVLSP